MPYIVSNSQRMQARGYKIAAATQGRSLRRGDGFESGKVCWFCHCGDRADSIDTALSILLGNR